MNITRTWTSSVLFSCVRRPTAHSGWSDGFSCAPVSAALLLQERKRERERWLTVLYWMPMEY